MYWMKFGCIHINKYLDVRRVANSHKIVHT